MTKPLVSVLITTYNYGRFIEESIDSVLSQDFSPDKLEVLVVDDGSTDDTAERVKKFGSKVRYFYQPNSGQASALNLGFANSRGEIIALLDADDYWLQGKLRRVTAEFEKHPEVGMVYHPFLEVDTATNQTRFSRTFLPISGSFFENPKEFFWYHPPGTAVSVRREILERLFPVPENIRMLADGYFNALIPFLSPVLAIPECLGAYRFHGKNSYFVEETQMPPETRKRRLEERQVLLDAKRKWLADNGFTREQPAVRSFLGRWTLYQESDEFLLKPPGRLQFFRHLIAYNRCYGPQMSSRLRFTNYINAFAALITGYKHYPLLDKWRVQLGVKRGTQDK